jgi:hypothetical protein
MISRIVTRVSLLSLFIGISLASAPASSQTSPSQQTSALDLVRSTVANEAAASERDSTKYMFRGFKKTPQGSQTRLYIETKEAMAGLTTAYNDRPLTSQQMQTEKGRLAGLAGNATQLQRKQQQEKEETEHTLRIVKALPEAFLFDYDGTEAGTATVGREGKPLTRLRFRPNPSYHCPSHVEDVLVGMQGFLLVDPQEKRIARIDGTLFKEVSFGWGIIGHLDKGGRFFVEQKDLGDGSWDVSRMTLDFTGKILLIKTLTIKSDEQFSDFHRVPANTTFAEGVKMLEDEQAKMESGDNVTRAENKTR